MKTYTGSFVSRDGVAWRVEIRQPADTEAAYTLDFPAREPVVLEWAHADKHEAVMGSVCTLTVISPADRSYTGLYADRVAETRLSLYRAGALWWQGTLDTEFYEEPYCAAKGYDVTLTFSDFGPLERIAYRLTGDRTLRELLDHCLEQAGLAGMVVDTSMVTTSLTDGGAPLTLAELSVMSENWYDEDGEPSTLREVLEGILQPLGLCVRQRAGKVWVYDLNGLYASGDGREVYWTDTDQTLGTDRVANRAVVTFSPYAKTDMGSPEVHYTGRTDEELQNTKHDEITHVTVFPAWWTYYNTTDASTDRYLSFTLFADKTGTGLAYLHPDCYYVHTTPIGSGDEADAVAHTFYSRHSLMSVTGASFAPMRYGLAVGAPSDTVLLRSHRVRIPHIADADKRKAYMLRIVVEALIDPRYNPFEEADAGNEEENYNAWSDNASDVRMQSRITLYSDDGTPLIRYENNIFFAGDGLGSLISSQWVSVGASEHGFTEKCCLEWRSPESATDGCGVLGWQKNRHNVFGARTIGKSISKREPGQYIPYPPMGGWIDVEILSGIYVTGPNVYTDSKRDELRAMLRWVLLKAPRIEVVKNIGAVVDASSEDIEYTGTLNEAAKEDMEIDTVCGTSAKPLPSARGCYLYTDGKTQVYTLSRAGRTTQAEQLLIGTLHSQYATRHTRLTGTARTEACGVCCRTDAAMPGVRFAVTAETQDLIAGDGEQELTELSPDEYDDQ